MERPYYMIRPYYGTSIDIRVGGVAGDTPAEGVAANCPNVE